VEPTSNALVDEMIEAYGGLAKWNSLKNADIHAIQLGATFAIKGVAGILNDFHYEVSTRQRIYPLGPRGARDGFMRFIESSVTEAVIRASEMPIFVIRMAKEFADASPGMWSNAVAPSPTTDA
jgi:hypothetical protein